MLKQIGPESLTVAFKHWQNLAVGTVLMAFSAYLTISAKSYVTNTTTQLQGWAMLIIAGVFYAVGYFLLNIETATLPADQTLSQAASLIIGGALFLTAVVIAVATAFTKPKK